MSEHYAYCKDAICAGCLPSDEALKTVPLIALFSEMLARCIAQSPQTKTREGAYAALVDDGPNYRRLAAKIRSERFAAVGSGSAAQPKER